MATSLSNVEIVDIAKSIEASGEAFYDEVLKHISDPEVQKTFTFLRDEEKRHELEFERLLANVAASKETWRQNEEYQGYMEALGSNRVFPDPEAARAAVRKLDKASDAIDFAISFEKDSILFLHEMRPLVEAESRPFVERLIDEERKHLLMLTKLRANYP